MLLMILGILDVVVGGALWMASGNPLTGSSIIIGLGIIWLLKGLWSFLSAAAGGFFFDFMGIFDMVAGALLALSYFGMAFEFFFYVALIMMIKGLWSFLIGMKV